MSELTYEVPVVGEKDTAAEPKVGTALTEIKTTVNGKLTAVNVENESLPGKKLKGTELFNEAYSVGKNPLVEKEEVEPSATRPTFVVATMKLAKEAAASVNATF